MNRKFAAALGFVFFLTTTFSYSQEYNDKFGLGFNAGGQRIYGEGRLTGVGIGIGFEGFASYRILRFADLSLAIGYSQLKYDVPIGQVLPAGTNTTDLFNLDVRTNLELISKGIVRPYLSLGVGELSFHVGNSGRGRFWDVAFIGGGGLRFRVSPKSAVTIAADYRHTTGDGFDGLPPSGAKDGYLSVRGGFAYFFPTAATEASGIIADNRAPIFEIEDDPFADQGQVSNDPIGSNGKEMEEYVRMKSRVDELNQWMEGREQEIARLQSQLSERRKQLNTLEKKAASQPPVNLPKSSSMSGFSQVYEEALTNYYNENYTESLSLFRLLLQQNPKHPLISSCHYWIGQNQYALNRFTEAVEAYQRVLDNNRSSKKDDALFQLGRTFLRMNNSATAKQFFTRLINECPGSEFVGEARTQMAKL